MSQKDLIFEHLRTQGSISPVEALVVHGIARLAARVQELRDGGLHIITTMSRDFNGRRYARYTLAD